MSLSSHDFCNGSDANSRSSSESSMKDSRSDNDSDSSHNNRVSRSHDRSQSNRDSSSHSRSSDNDDEVFVPVRTSVLRHMVQMGNVQREFARQVSLRTLEMASQSGHSINSKFQLTVNDSQSGKSFHECYDLGEILGEGGFAVVYRCYHKKTRNSYAVKRIRDQDYDLDGTNSLVAEIKHMKIVRDCSWIIQLFDVFRDGFESFLVLEEVNGGDLLDKLYSLGKYSVADAKLVTHQLLDAIRFCHKREVAHRDIKPENILIVESENPTKIKLCDFGCSKSIAEIPFKTLIGSPLYCAPEVFEHEETEGYDHLCDLWSTGIVVFLLLVGYCPFDDGPVMEIARHVTLGDWEFDKEDWSDIPEPPKELIRSLLVVNPRKRASADNALNSKWMRRPELDRPASFRQSRISNLQTHVQQMYESSPQLNFDELSFAKISHGPMVWQDQEYAPPVRRETLVSEKRFSIPDTVDASEHDKSEGTEFSELGASKLFEDSWSALSPVKSSKSNMGASWGSSPTPPTREDDDTNCA